jgi:DNA-binding NtrC family response regulator
MQPKVLVADDDAAMREVMALALVKEGFRVTRASTAAEATAAIGATVFDLVVADIYLGDGTGLDVVEALHEAGAGTPVILVTARGTVETAATARSRGVFDYLAKPFALGHFLSRVRAALAAETVPEKAPSDGPESMIVGSDPAIVEGYKAVARVAPLDVPVLIRGETGTGKELVATALHRFGANPDGPFVAINCGAIPETLLESELFGFERGAFTGAHQRRIGKVEQADRGTLFLDEIGDVPLPIQAKLLRLLEDRRIERIGGREPIPVDVRILAATNRDLEEAIAGGRFRSDLFYRLNVVPIHLPPLAERADDVPLLCDYYLERFALELGVRNPGLTDGAYAELKAHSWPGNVRELANLMEQCLIFSRGQHVDAGMVQRLLQGGQEAATDPFQAVDQELDRAVRHALTEERADLLDAITERVVRRIIAEVLRHTDGNQTRAARLLGVSRPTLLARMRKLGLR